MEPRFRILMVDDVVRYHKLYELAITDELPAKVHFAVNGEEALSRLAGVVSFDLLILDLNMPKLGGEETLRRIRQDPSFDVMPVIILTGDHDPSTQKRLLELGADDFIEKGAPPEVFVARLKAQLRHKLALDRLTRLAVDMDIFAAGVLHDIRNLETNILVVCELAREYLRTDPVKHAPQILSDVQSLEDRADSLSRYASRIIGMVRETQRPLELSAQPLRPLVEWAMKTASPIGDASAPKLTWSYEGELAPVLADKHFLQLALLNIAQNAVKYRREGAPPHVVVSQSPAAVDPSRAQGKSLVTRLADNGRGIKKSDLRKVFEPFVRGSDARKDGGFGLGLSLVAKVIGSMGGRVWAESQGDKAGAVLCIELPAAEGSA